MATKCENCPLRRRKVFAETTAEGLEFMQKFKVGELVVDAGTTILMEGSNSPQLFTALHGMGLRYKTLDSDARQVINFVFPGDFLGLQAGVMREMGHSVEAVTKMTLCVFDRREIWTLFKSYPEMAFDLVWLTSAEERFLGEALATVGQRTALESVAWALLKLYQRADALNLAEDDGMPLPIRQQDLADALGLSLVHTNKTLAKIRDLQLASWSDGLLTIADMEGLAALAGTDLSPVRTRPLI
ncbi:Crp/Fnr family transcriptional regulator [Jannaschia pohangensis]|uniref:cAMP-binding domain of CRP or a regulatory subunit of cAMP-dependent protein kinases n=1 Tax=Jannaschia pohangensis TaxID=390807 RepID=A0A1I3IJ39_9RHOB|nr:Crp/Fnr family transcriptional regulator [Jannaschia pohangensis]SFI47932.1 cAMP-binding domain of CRP or a regulatory subunit of cAMP-dependent protein kinases [Jannaschia pohangensis]